MLSKIEDRHREQGARLLKTCYTFYAGPRDNSDETSNLYTLGLALVEDYPTNFRPLDSIPKAEKRELCSELQGRLRSRCGGLLEIDSMCHVCLCELEVQERHDLLIDSKVVFMHRTVFEFLRDDTVWNLGVLSLPEDDSYDVATALSLFSLHIAKKLLPPGGRIGRPEPWFEDGLRWSSVADAQPGGDPGLFLDNMRPVLQHLTSDYSKFTPREIQDILTSTDCLAHTNEQTMSFIIAVYLGMVNYVKRNFYLHQDIFDCVRGCPCPPLLSFTLNKRLLTRHYNPLSQIDPEDLSRTRDMVALFLSSGYNPNEELRTRFTDGVPSFRDFHSITPWTVFLGWARSTPDFEPRDTAAATRKSIISQMIDDFLRYGAELKDLKFDLIAWRASEGLGEKQAMARNQTISKSQSMPTNQSTMTTHSTATTQSIAATVEARSANNTPVSIPQQSEWAVVETPQGSSRVEMTGSSQTGAERSVGPSLPAQGSLVEGVSSLKRAKFSKTRKFKDWVKRYVR